MGKIHCAIIGSGNIGTDLIYKLQRSDVLKPVWMVGIDPQSEGLSRASKLGLKTTAHGVDGLLPHVLDDDVRIAFDATSAYVHAYNDRVLQALGVVLVDLTPAAIGPLCVPAVNLREHATSGTTNVNMISCAGQATIPMVRAVSKIQSVSYAEIVASLSSKSVGPGTRANLDEFSSTTARAIQAVGGARIGKALAVVNPAEPPLIMRNTIYCLTDEVPNRDAMTRSVFDMISSVNSYMPGYRLVNGPLFDESPRGHRVAVYMEAEGLGDYLPKYAGNLDIMTAAASRTAEVFASEMLAGRLQRTCKEIAA
jgi:acetaldehyde/propanal dehydrogenase